ncbi:ankyrin repeat-containing protein ITN1-like [Malania oleifera]|uniref:ankyrin repeat-containing protein ITN1-like n=1 Tax=Malania oleifera TaxID=397392 RepID=UPI0025AECBAD|nr:ankyrin repeat-containing protein ITN1-like [Malania oleifera]
MPVAKTKSSVNASQAKGEGSSNSMHHSPTQWVEKQEKEEENPDQRSSIVWNDNSALVLATKSGCVEIVEEILKMYPQAVEHINAKGRNVLHVAIRHRQMKVLDHLERMETPMRRLIRKIDNQGNSILHMVGMKTKKHMKEKTRSPAIQLQQELHLFERVKEISNVHFIKHYNCKWQTAGELFITNNEELHKEAREWLKRTSKNCIIVVVLIATVAFAAAYTNPGGTNQSTALPVLLYQPFFMVFTLTDVLSLTFSMSSIITFLSILTSPFRLQDFEQSLPHKLMLGFTFLILSLSMMMVPFAATITLMINKEERWTKIALYLVALLPVTIFVLSYLPPSLCCPIFHSTCP